MKKQGRGGEGRERPTPAPHTRPPARSPSPAQQGRHLVASSCFRCCSRRASRQSALCTAACDRAHERESSLRPGAEPPLGAGGLGPAAPSLTWYCFRRLLTLSSFLATAVFTLSRQTQRGWGPHPWCPAPNTGLAPCPRRETSAWGGAHGPSPPTQRPAASQRAAAQGAITH